MSIVTVLASGNTFSLFKRHGGVEVDFSRFGEPEPVITRAQCQQMIDQMLSWADTPEAPDACKRVGCDLGHVHEKIENLKALLADPKCERFTLIAFERFGDDNRELDEMLDMADEYCHSMYDEAPD